MDEEKPTSCCDMVELFSECGPSKGLSFISCINSKTKEVSQRLTYRQGKSLKSKWAYVAYCPFCGAKHNRDLPGDYS